jgi:arabinogalactan endo-1,4-beta-galactosidase
MDRHEPDHKMLLGHDLSTLQQLEDVGRTFSDDGRVQLVERIVAHHGATYIRERLWVNPPIPYNDLSHILTMARRIKAAGLKLLLDFHYCDFWADPGKQPTLNWAMGEYITLLFSISKHKIADVVPITSQRYTGQ